MRDKNFSIDSTTLLTGINLSLACRVQAVNDYPFRYRFNNAEPVRKALDFQWKIAAPIAVKLV